MILESGKHPAQLKDMVCSPGGTTITGVHQLEKSGLRVALMDAVEAATNQAKYLSRHGDNTKWHITVNLLTSSRIQGETLALKTGHECLMPSVVSVAGPDLWWAWKCLVGYTETNSRHNICFIDMTVVCMYYRDGPNDIRPTPKV